MKTMVPSLPLPELLGYAAPFPTQKHKAAVVRVPRLAALAIFSAQQLASLRSWGLVKLLELAMPGAHSVWICVRKMSIVCRFQCAVPYRLMVFQRSAPCWLHWPFSAHSSWRLCGAEGW
jgi:hypothetical protein